MEEEVTQKTIMLSIKAIKLTAEVLKAALRKYLAAQQRKGKIHTRKTSLVHLSGKPRRGRE